MAIELDHVFICVASGAIGEAGSLTAFGLAEGRSNTHPGQGTACRRFFFCNAYVELLWVEKPEEAQSELVRPMRLWERWTGRGEQSCPFGLGFRPGASGGGSPPFPTWPYRPGYLPDSQSIPVATNSSIVGEPMLFYLPFAQRPDTLSQPGRRQPLDHPCRFREVSRVELVLPTELRISPELQSLTHLLDLTEGPEHLLVLGFDGESRGKSNDFRPTLPLVFRW